MSTPTPEAAAKSPTQCLANKIMALRETRCEAHRHYLCDVCGGEWIDAYAQAQAHPECHPAALCDGPEQAREIQRLEQARIEAVAQFHGMQARALDAERRERATWEAAEGMALLQMFATDVESPQTAVKIAERLAAQFRARATAQGGNR